MDLDKELEIERRKLRLTRVDPQEFEFFYEKYSDKIYSYLLRRTLDPDVAMDLVSDTFATALDKLGRFQWQRVTFGAWLYRIAVNKVNQHYRKTNRFKNHDPDFFDSVATPGPGPLGELLQDETQVHLYRCLARLDEQSINIFLLHYWDNLKVREIAVVLNMKEGTIQSRLKRDRERIRHMMEQGDVALHKPQGQETAQVAPGSSIDDVEFDVRGENDE